MSDYKNTQESIVRQSSLKFVSDYQRSVGCRLTLKEVMGITNVIVDYCQNGWSKELSERVDKIDDFIKQKYEEPY